MKKILSFLLVLTMILAAASGSAFAAESEKDANEVLSVKEDNVYANEFLGIMASFSDDWYLFNDEETIEAMGYVVDAMEDTGLADQLRNSGVVCDLYAAVQDNSGDNINVQIENLGFLYGITMSEDAYYEAAAPQLETALEQMGLKNVSLTKETMTFAGDEHVTCLVSGELSGMKLYERMVMIKAGMYMATVTAFSFDRESVDTMLEIFEAYDAKKLAA